MANISIESYFHVLGVSSNASIEEIKRAYRQKAKILHPDKNKSAEAHEQFILLTEAYECLINIKSGKTSRREQTNSYDDWLRHKRDETRQRAREYAKMQYEEYRKTDHYKKSQAALIVFEHLYFISAVIVMLSPLWGYLFKDWLGFGVGIFFAIISANFWAGIFTEKITLNLTSFFQSLFLIIKTRTFIYSIIILANLFVLLRFTLNTQLTIYSFSIIILVLYALTYFAYRLQLSPLNKVRKSGLFLCLIPSIFNLFFLINFIFSSNPTTEVYSFVHKQVWYGRYGRYYQTGSFEKIAYIDLSKNKYEDYHWFRMFFDFGSMVNKSEITYKFEDGLFGLRVLKKYDFTK